MTCDSREFFKLYFHELEQRSIPFVILHSYNELPENISSDIDYAVPDAHLRKLGAIQIDVAHKHGWALVQTLQHGVFAYYAVLVNLENPAETLKLDACSSYARIRRLLVSESILLGDRVPYRGFYIPAPAAEFIYILAKMFDAKNKSPAKYLPRLKELWLKDPATAQKYFTDLFGETRRPLEQWFDTPPDEWRGLGKIMFARNRFGPGLMLRESARVVKRTFQPTGVYLAILGSDGSGKSTLLANLLKLLEPCFRSQQTMHFRPMVLLKRTHDDAAAVADPHGRPPRNALGSLAESLFIISWIIGPAGSSKLCHRGFVAHCSFSTATSTTSSWMNAVIASAKPVGSSGYCAISCPAPIARSFSPPLLLSFINASRS